ncbi:cysteine dioxygenase family protein [Sphingomonas sp. PP-CC-3G-468]|uniref:cysteine dioxygenase n=1 Tax=Sphingomonas sp. PP-CC-3G-468 TaxID=2135656 RepID=UPI0010441B9F|nr:cysteine dioxygenase family protein [Sphingomonas sp. PP-CC-3G-468]TCM07477.1 hypothetical protein C8J41_103385 [Sphingomonas sp. PP-CC-3G-468]
MSHAGEDFLSVPAHLTLTPDDESGGRIADFVRLPVLGQGTVGFMVAEKVPFSVGIQSKAWGTPALRWNVGFDGVTLHEHAQGAWHPVLTMPNPDAEPGLLQGLDPDPACRYWFSFDYHNRRLRYGKGEMRLGCMIAECRLPAKSNEIDEDDDPYQWLRQARRVEVTATIRDAVDVWRDPVTVDVPMKIVPHDRMTMDMMAEGKTAVPGNLTPTCRQLYDNVAGESFRLDTPDFPEFAQAIRESLKAADGWCRKTLERKADEFGTPDPDKTYLRITLGQNQGDSPGVPFVMEIWPVGHYSPIHDHGGAEAVIKVLHGAINVDLYRMLSPHHQQPFSTAVFETNDVAWISSRLNQVHKLVNRGELEPCITIQCYLYAETNEAHWPYFDYLAKSKIAHFDPNSDDDYVSFKARMKEEWNTRHAIDD